MLLQILSLFQLVQLGASLSCDECNCVRNYCYEGSYPTPMDEWEPCPKLYPSNCTSGQITAGQLTPCGCCDECAKAVGQACEGLWGLLGSCAAGLTCNGGDNDDGGICHSERKIEQTSGDAYVLDNSTDNVASSVQEVQEDCSCFNPLSGSLQEFAGAPAHVCKMVEWCFIPCSQNCR